MPRRANGEGTIKKTASGKWRAVVKVDGKQVSGPSVERKSDALPALNRKLRQPPASILSVGESAWRLAEKKERDKTWRESTAYVMKSLIGSCLDETWFADYPVSKVTQATFDKWLSEVEGSPSHRKNVGTLVARALKEVGRPVSVGIRTQVQSMKTRVLTPEERQKFLDAAGEEERTAIVLMLRCGLRRGEALGVKGEDLADGGFWVRRHAIVSAGKVKVTKLKTEKSERWVPLPSEPIEFNPGWLTPDPRTELPRHPSWLAKKVVLAGETAGIGHVSPHDLRHTAAMAFLEAGVDVVTASEILGHDPVILAKVYAKSRRDLKLEAMRKLDGHRSVQSDAPKGAARPQKKA